MVFQKAVIPAMPRIWMTASCRGFVFLSDADFLPGSLRVVFSGLSFFPQAPDFERSRNISSFQRSSAFPETSDALRRHPVTTPRKEFPAAFRARGREPPRGLSDKPRRGRCFAASSPFLRRQCGRQTDDDEQGRLTFEIEKGRLRFRPTAPYSEERRRAASAWTK